METVKLDFDCEELLNWWEPKADISFIFKFNWTSLQQLREAITFFLSARLYAMSQRAAKAISETGCARLKKLMASNPETPADLLDYLATVCCGQAVVSIAENPASSPETLVRLSLHDDPEVRMAVSENLNTPESCIKQLVHDKCSDVRYRLAENPHAPLAALYELLKDDNPYISNRARQTLSRVLRYTITRGAMMIAEDSQMSSELERDDSSSQFRLKLIEQLHGLNTGTGQIDFSAH